MRNFNNRVVVLQVRRTSASFQIVQIVSKKRSTSFRDVGDVAQKCQQQTASRGGMTFSFSSCWSPCGTHMGIAQIMRRHLCASMDTKCCGGGCDCPEGCSLQLLHNWHSGQRLDGLVVFADDTAQVSTHVALTLFTKKLILT